MKTAGHSVSAAVAWTLKSRPTKSYHASPETPNARPLDAGRREIIVDSLFLEPQRAAGRADPVMPEFPGGA